MVAADFGSIRNPKSNGIFSDRIGFRISLNSKILGSDRNSDSQIFENFGSDRILDTNFFVYCRIGSVFELVNFLAFSDRIEFRIFNISKFWCRLDIGLCKLSTFWSFFYHMSKSKNNFLNKSHLTLILILIFRLLSWVFYNL